MRLATIIPAILIACFASTAMAQDPGCFIKDGDRVGFFGDSITEAAVYGQATELVFHHFHPDANVSFVNNGHSGLQLAGTSVDLAAKGEANVVTIMIGMNDAINSQWMRGMPIAPKAAEYKANLTKLVRGLKERGKVVVILTPTLTDESAEMSCFRIEGTRLLLAAMGQACEEVAREESVFCVPVQGEFESYQDSLPPFAQLRPDGVHPCARGHYQIARSLWGHLNLAGPLGGDRVVSPAPPAPQASEVKVALVSNIIPVDSDSLEFSISSPKPAPAKLTWNLGQARGVESLTLMGKDHWTLKLPKGALPQANGQAATLVMDIQSQGTRQVFIVDIFRKMVIHGTDGMAGGTINDAKGVQICSYLFRKEDKGLVFEASVKKKELVPSNNNQWPWGNGDALTLYLDVRKGSRLGAPGFDGNVYQVWFKPQEKPFFSPGFHPWSGKHMTNIATASGEKTADGYKVALDLAGSFNTLDRIELSDLDFFGFDLSVFYATAIGKKTEMNAENTDRKNFLYPGAFALVDINHKLTGDSAFTASVFPDNP